MNGATPKIPLLSPYRLAKLNSRSIDNPFVIDAGLSAIAVPDGFKGVRILPAMQFDMAVTKTDHRSCVVIRTWGVAVVSSAADRYPKGRNTDALRLEIALRTTRFAMIEEISSPPQRGKRIEGDT